MDIKYAVEIAHDENILTHELPLAKEVSTHYDDCHHQTFGNVAKLIDSFGIFRWICRLCCPF